MAILETIDLVFQRLEGLLTANQGHAGPDRRRSLALADQFLAWTRGGLLSGQSTLRDDLLVVGRPVLPDWPQVK